MPGASSSREERTPLNVGARLGLYAMLGALVLASFVVAPTRTPATPVVAGEAQDVARAAPMARGFVRQTPDLADAPLAASPSSAPTQEPRVDVLSPTEEMKPEPTPDPEPEPTPPPPTPRPPTPRPFTPITNATTAWAEAHMLALINASRAQGGLVALAMDVGVAAAARAHSGVESQVRYVYHDGADGTARSRDVSACGTAWYGENTGKIWNDNVDALHIEFMNEPWEPINHRTNIMDPNFRRIGVGAVIGPDALYMTMVFCR